MATQQEFEKQAYDAVLAYKAADAKKVAEDAIAAKADLVSIINNGFTKGIQEVGALFEQKKLFLPHIMAAANAMNAGIDVLAPNLEAGATGGDLGKFLICSIEGDIHSIGKDIVAVMMKVAGFDVVNLGRDIAIVDIVEACKKEAPVAVGTSALMTSTMVGQKTFEEALKAAGIRDKLLTNVGGAPVSQDWSDEIGADVYSENATDCVNKMVAAVKDN